jgi:hypothetical protein
MAELRKVDLGHGQGFTSLAEALDAFPETKFNIDVKSRDAVPGTIAAITKAGAHDRVLVSSFDERRRALALRGLPGVVSSASARRFVLALLAGKVGFSPALRGSLRGLVAVQVPEKALGLRVVSPLQGSHLHIPDCCLRYASIVRLAAYGRGHSSQGFGHAQLIPDCCDRSPYPRGLRRRTGRQRISTRARKVG